MDVIVSGPAADVRLLVGCSDRQRRFRFLEAGFPGAVPLRIADTPAERPFWASRTDGVSISTRESEGICGYAEISRESYLAVCAILGLVQWRALMLNELLIEEDFIAHEESPRCLFAARGTIQEYALAFEYPGLCDSCLDFYRCLGAEPEILALQEVLRREATSAWR